MTALAIGALTALGGSPSLVDSGLEFRFSLLGQEFENCPPVYREVAKRLGVHLERDGFVESREEYWRILASADVALSTARHEFQGLAVLEACAAGATPLVPDALAYRELFPEEWRYGNDAALCEQLIERVRELKRWRATDPRPVARPFTWPELVPRWERFLDSGPGGA